MKRNAALIVLIVFFVAAFGFASQNWIDIDGMQQQPEVTVLKSTDKETILECHVTGFFSDDVYQNGEKFQNLSFPGYYTTLDIGKPQLPVITEIVAIPPNAKVSVSVEYLSTKKIDGYNVAPFQKPVLENEPPPAFKLDYETYSQNTFYPQMPAELSNEGYWRNLKVTALKIYPIQYNAFTDELVVHTNLRVTLTYSESSGGYGIDRSIPESFNRVFENTIINYKQLNLPVHQFGGSRTKAYDLLIIAADSYEDEADDYATYKELVGYSTEVVLTSSLGNTPELIREFIQEEYENNSISYVLFIGNEDDIPGYTGYNCFSDYYYTLLDGNDNFADIGIGRFCVHDSEELGWMMEKSAAYESNAPGGDWLDNALLVAHQQNAPLKYQQCKEEIRTAEYSVLSPEFTTAYGADSAYGGDNATNADVINYINDGMRVVNYRGHGDTTIWWNWNYLGQNFGYDQVDSLDNGAMTPVFFGIACNNNMLDSDYYCLGEYFTLTDDGAVAYLSASRASFTEPNHTYDKKIFLSIFDEGINAISDASNAAAALIITQHGYVGLINARMYLWLGDPTLQVIYPGPLPRVRYVPDEYPTIQDAIDACNNYDTVMVSPGLYAEAIDFLGKRIVVTSTDGANETTIQGVSRSRPVVFFQSGERHGTELSGFTITFGQKSGIYVYRSSPTIKDCIIAGNYSYVDDNGGGIYLFGAKGAVVRNNIFYDNYADGSGAALYMERCSGDTVAYNLIYDNTSNFEISCIASSVLLHNNTIATSDSSDIAILAQETGTLILKSNIIKDATRCGIYAFGDAEAYLYYNCFYNNNINWAGDVTDVVGNLEDDPLLTSDFRIQPESPCLDAGWPGITEPSRYWYDPDGTRNDIGVYPVYQVDAEAGPVYYSIQLAINDVEDGDFVYVHPGAYHPINFVGKRIVVTSSEGPTRTSIVGAAMEAAVVYFQSGEPKGAEISGFTLRYGARGAVYCYRSSPTILNNIIYENTSSEEYVGAGIDLNYTSKAVIKGNTFSHNVADGFGGGIVAQYSVNDTICYNLFESLYGRGTIYAEYSTMAIYNNTIDNLTMDGPGICAMHEGEIDCRNNIIVNADSYGFYGRADARISADYNDVWNYGLGPYAGTVAWGDNNIDLDPLLTDDYMLDRQSPCIDAGDPDPFFNDPDGSRNDMGWKPYTEALARGEVGVEVDPLLPTEYSLNQNFPNPFNASSTIQYALPEASQVNIRVYDILGRRVATLVDEFQPAGYYQLTWEADNLSSGTYFYRIQAGDYTDSKKMLLLK